MRCKLVVEGKEFDIDILDPELQKLLKPPKPPKRTGYERANECGTYFYSTSDGEVDDYSEIEGDETVQSDYDAANYYSDLTVAKNNIRADNLMRKLRRFAVEHRERELVWKPFSNKENYYIAYDYGENRLMVHVTGWAKGAFAIYFDYERTAQLAIDTFHDELIWYFTEYKDSL